MAASQVAVAVTKVEELKKDVSVDYYGRTKVVDSAGQLSVSSSAAYLKLRTEDLRSPPFYNFGSMEDALIERRVRRGCGVGSRA